MHVIPARMPNAMSNVYVFIDSCDGHDASGTIYVLGGTVKSTFSGLTEMVIKCDKILSSASVVKASFCDRDFGYGTRARNSKQAGQTGAVPNESRDVKELSENAAFIVHIQQRLNATWQGDITWVARCLTRHFLSSLDMIKLIEQALAAEYGVDINTGWK